MAAGDSKMERSAFKRQCPVGPQKTTITITILGPSSNIEPKEDKKKKDGAVLADTTQDIPRNDLTKPGQRNNEQQAGKEPEQQGCNNKPQADQQGAAQKPEDPERKQPGDGHLGFIKAPKDLSVATDVLGWLVRVGLQQLSQGTNTSKQVFMDTMFDVFESYAGCRDNEKPYYLAVEEPDAVARVEQAIRNNDPEPLIQMITQ